MSAVDLHQRGGIGVVKGVLSMVRTMRKVGGLTLLMTVATVIALSVILPNNPEKRRLSWRPRWHR